MKNNIAFLLKNRIQSGMFARASSEFERIPEALIVEQRAVFQRRRCVLCAYGD
jgi:hypothetical protein